MDGGSGGGGLAGSGGSGGGFGAAVGGGGRFDNVSGGVGGGGGGGDGSLARGLLFEVREFYGPTRVVVELVSGGSGGGGGGGSGGGSGHAGGGAVLGRCEARLAEALVGRGGGSASSAGLTKTTAVFEPGQRERGVDSCS